MYFSDHVIRDLEPFVCISPQCTDSSHQKPGISTFEISKTWLSHLQNAHGFAWECRAPSHEPLVFQQEGQYQEHSCKEHGVPEAHVALLSKAARRPVLTKVSECPFGDDFQPPEHAKSHTVFSSEALHLHVAAHMKEIALLALQKLPDDADETSEDVASDAPVEDDGVGPARPRDSMYSVLDDEALDFEDEAGRMDLDQEETNIGPSVEKLQLEDETEGVDGNGMTQLHRAVWAGDLALVQSLIDKGTTLRSTTHDGKTALHYACLEDFQNLDILRLLLESGGREILNVGDHNGQTPLHCAAETDYSDGIYLLIEYGADLDRLDNYNVSPYFWAVCAGHREAAVSLLNSGVDVNSGGPDGRSGLSIAASMGYSALAALLVERGANVMSTTPDTQMVPLEEAAAWGDISTVQLLLGQGADPTYRDRDGWSAIHFAAEEGNLEVVRLLLNDGANVNAVSSYGTSPLHCAANGGQDSIARLLLLHGADPLHTTCHGWTPLHHAAYLGHAYVAQTLLKDDRMASSATYQDNHGWTVLHLAVYSRDLATIKTLLRSSSIDMCRTVSDERSLTPEDWLNLAPMSHSYKAISDLAFDKSRCCRAVTELRQVVLAGNPLLVQLLLRQREDINRTDSGQRTALYYAVKKGLAEMITMLLDHGAHTNILPTGRTMWEEFVSDDAVLAQLKQAGYRKPETDPELEQQIKLALRGQEQPLVPDQSASNGPMRSPPPVRQVSASSGKAETNRSGASKIWKRLRRQ